MTKMEKASAFSRRSVLKGAGAFVVSIGMPVGLDTVLGVNAARAQGGRPPLTPDQLSSYIAVNSDGTVSAFFGKTDMAQGLFTAIGQMVAEELDVPHKAVTVIMGNTATSVNQGGSSGSTGIQFGGKQMRMAAAEARRVLLGMAAERLGTPADQLIVVDGVVSAAFNRDKKISYAELIGGRYFNVQLEWNKQIGNQLYAPGKAQPKKHTEYKIVGKSIPRDDIAPVVYCTQDFVTDLKVPGMVHGRMIRPPVAGAVPDKIDESSIKDIPGAKVVRQGHSFLGVVADKEWDAIKAAQKLKVEWSNAAPPFPDQAAIYDHIRKAPVRHRKVEKDTGNIDEAFRTAARVVEAEYEWPFQSHACMGPGCGVVDVKADKVTVWTGSPKSHFCRDGVANILGVPIDKVEGISMQFAGAYGRNDAGDACMDAAILSKAVGKPVRVQYTRDEGTGWDPKGPASIHRARAAIDASGNVIGYEFYTKGFSRHDVQTNEARPERTLAGHFLGVPLKSEDMFGVPAEVYEYASRRTSWETIPPLLDRASPLRTSHLRDPVGPQLHFASESFVDEVAHAIGVDPVQYRLKYLGNERHRAVVQAAAEKAGWVTRTSPRRDQTGSTVSGRGIAYAPRNSTIVAIVAEVEVDRSTGKIWARKFTVGHDCGQIINPKGLQDCIEGNVIQGVSRTLWEETRFDQKSVTSVDWMTYPILDITEAPEKIEFALINRPELPPTGAGEPSIRVVAAAIANAVFDATGVRIRRVPFSPDKVKGLLS
jgi:CO/xanthine dehydrogenase Mo-binding subunit